MPSIATPVPSLEDTVREEGAYAVGVTSWGIGIGACAVTAAWPWVAMTGLWFAPPLLALAALVLGVIALCVRGRGRVHGGIGLLLSLASAGGMLVWLSMLFSALD